MKKQQEIVKQAQRYKKQLSAALQEKDLNDDEFSPDIDLIIFSLVDKLETLFWVLDIELPDGDMLERLHHVNH